MAEWSLSYVRTEDIDRHWGWIARFLEKAFWKAPTEITVDEVYQRAKEDRARIWLVLEGDRTVPTALFVAGEWPDKTVEVFVLSGWRLIEWLEPVVEDFCSMARDQGLKRLRIGGRKGWLRRLKPLGFVFLEKNSDRVVMEKVF